MKLVYRDNGKENGNYHFAWRVLNEVSGSPNVGLSTIPPETLDPKPWFGARDVLRTAVQWTILRGLSRGRVDGYN